MNTIFKKWLFLSLTPLYLFLIYYKTVTGADLEGLMMVSVIILVVFLPVQLLVQENNLSASRVEIFEDETISHYLSAVFVFMTIFTIYIFLFYAGLQQQDKATIRVVVGVFYISWWYVSHQLLNIYKYVGDTSKLKMLFLFLFIVALIVSTSLAKLPSHMGWEYFLVLFVELLKVGFTLLLIIPTLGIKVISMIFKAMFRRTFRLKSPTINSTKDVEEMLKVPVISYLVFIGVGVPMINQFSIWISSVDTYNIALLLTISMIFISLMGVVFQLQIFISEFVQESQKAEKLLYLSIGAFYLAMIVNMGVVNTIENSSLKMQGIQTEIMDSNVKLQEWSKRH